MPIPSQSSVTARLRELACGYPPALQAAQLSEARRIAFHLSLLSSAPEGGRVADIGGGVGLFSLGAQALGFRATLVDDFRDAVNAEHGEAALEPHRKSGVEVVSRDVVADGVDFAPASLDAVTSFDSIEHWHHSPRKLLHQLVAALKPGGLFILGAPNCVNMRKRLTVPMGRGSWSGFDEWYGAPVFRGHVREPDVRDLRRVAADLALREVKIFGRNWQGHASASGLIRAMTAIFDSPLRLRAGWCSDIYLVGRKEAGGGQQEAGRAAAAPYDPSNRTR
jgi:SAM-dependent methyltransferase